LAIDFWDLSSGWVVERDERGSLVDPTPPAEHHRVVLAKNKITSWFTILRYWSKVLLSLFTFHTLPLVDTSYSTATQQKNPPLMKRRRVDAVTPDEKNQVRRFNPALALPFAVNLKWMPYLELREMARLQNFSKAYKPLVTAHLKQLTSITMTTANEQECRWLLEHCKKLKQLTFDEYPWSSSLKSRSVAELIMNNAKTLHQVYGVLNNEILCALSHCSELKTLDFPFEQPKEPYDSGCLALLLSRVRGIESADLGELDDAEQQAQVLQAYGTYKFNSFFRLPLQCTFTF
jgi:hypothetical protein